MNLERRELKQWRRFSIVLMCLLIAAVGLYGWNLSDTKEPQKVASTDALSETAALTEQENHSEIQTIQNSPQAEEAAESKPADVSEEAQESKPADASEEAQESKPADASEEAGEAEPTVASEEAESAVSSDETEEEKAAVLTLWAEDAPARQELISYMEAITQEGGEEYIPPEDRIAVFDLDGTLFCETDPNYFDYCLLKHRVLEDPDYKDRASDFEKEVANKIREQNETGKSFSGLEVDHGKAVASAFAGMTLQEFFDYIQDFKEEPAPGYEGMKRGEGFYQPMLQVVDYLQENEFTVYIISGTDRFIVRGIVAGTLNLPAGQIIGSDETVVTRDQGDTDGLDYVFDDDDELVLGGEFLIKNLKMNKVAVIAQEIGQQPVLSFGNSTGDSSMAEYVTSHNPYKSLAFMLCCDDTERENGKPDKAEKMVSLCQEYDWVPVSMKNDWLTIYGEQVTRKSE